MTTRMMHPPEIEQQRNRARFDPVREGDRYRLSSDASTAIWERVCSEATDASGARDLERAKRRFHEIAALVAAHGGGLAPEVGRSTRTGAELGDTPLTAWTRSLLARPVPGRETLVSRHEAEQVTRATQATADETRHGAERSQRSRPGEPLEVTGVGTQLEVTGAGNQPEVSRAGDVAPQRRSITWGAPIVVDLTESGDGRRPAGADPSTWSPPRPDAERRDGQLPAATRARMEQAYGQDFAGVEIHADSPEMPAGQEAFTRGHHIYFARGAFDPDSAHGEHVIAHELAHVAQQGRPLGTGGVPTSRAALEADAHQAALAALAGRAASVNLFAPASAALGFSNGEPPVPGAAPGAGPRPGSAPGGGGGAPAQIARGAGPAPSGSAATGGAGAGGANASPAVFARPGGGSPGAGTRSPEAPGARPAAAPPGESAPSTAAPAPRRATGGDLLMPEAPTALTPAAAGRLQAIHGDNQGVAAATTQLPTAQQQTDVARAAVVEPKAEQDAHAQHGVVAAVDDRPPPSPEIEAACARIRQVIRDKRPPSEDKLVDAKPKDMAQAAGDEMSAGVEQRAGSVRQGYADMQQNPQGTPSTTPVPATLPPDKAPTQPVDAASGAPDPLKHDDVSLDGDVSAQQQKLQDAGMNTDAGKLVKDGPIGDARGGVDDLQGMAKTDPQKVLADQAAAIAHAKGDMAALQAAAEKALAEARAGAVGHMATHTTTVKGSEEQQRAAAGVQMQAIFTRTQQTVDRLLQPLSGNAVARWEAGVAQLSTEFETSLAKVKQKIQDRHSGVGGFFTGLGDDVFGLPEWVTLDYDAAEKKFGDGATSLITDISRDVNQVIEDCKKLIDQGRKDIEAVVKSLPASLQSWAQGEAQRLGQQLDQLSARVDQAQKGLNQDLISKANGAVQTVRERVADLREQAKGLIGKIADALIEFAKNPGKAIVDGLLRLVGIPPASFWALVDKLGNVISGIAADPMKFANTLMSGVGKGFQQFFDHLPVRLGQSLFQWLFSKMSDVGIQMPLDFTVPSILTLVLEVMGITWTRIKTILAKHVGAQNVEILDQAYQLINTLINRGPLGVYHLVQEHLDPAMIIDAIKNAAISYVMEAIITRVAARIIMMLNPAGAILQAIEAIYRVIKWVIDNAARIFTLIEAVVNGAAQILAGNVSGVANLVERALGLLLVPVIDFLADYLGLGGIPEALKKVIMGLQSKVEMILDKVIGFVVDKAKALWQAMKGGKKPDKDGNQKDDKDKKEAHAWWKVKKPFHAASGGQHTLFFHGQGAGAQLYMASEPRSLEAVLADRDLSIEDKATLEAGLKAIKDKIAANPDIGQKPDAEQTKFQGEINEMVQKLAQEFASRLQHEGKLPASTVTFGSSGDRASFAMGMPLTKNPGNTTGSGASGRLGTAGDRFVDKFVKKSSHTRHDKDGNEIEVRMNPLDQVHLLHSDLHGPFSAENIALGDKSLNGQMRAAEQAAIAAIKADGQVRYRVSVAYHSNVAPPDDVSEIPGSVDQTIKSWIGYYIAQTMTVTSAKMSGTEYSVALTGATASGDLPPIHGEVVETMDDRCMRVARANLDPSVPNREENGAVFLATRFNRQQLQAALECNINQIMVAAKRLQDSGRLLITMGPKARVFVRQ